MENIFKFFGSKEKQAPTQEKDINQLRDALKAKLKERDELLSIKSSSFGSPQDMERDAKVKKLDGEIPNLRKEVSEKEVEHKQAA